MTKSKRNKILWVIFFALFTLYNFCTFIYPHYKSKKELLKVPYGIAANPLRIKLKIPVIEEDMEPLYEYGKFKGSNRWESAKEFPGYGEILHPFKNVDADWKNLRLKNEGDSFRRKINDSICEQLNIDCKLTGDSVAKRAGLLFLRPYN